MNFRLYIFISLLALSASFTCSAQTEVNVTDKQGLKQGLWIKKYPQGTKMYEGYFKDNHPVGEFKRYYETSIIKSLLVYSPDGKEADATLYHPDGKVASKGKYINQMKEGKWQFFTADSGGYLISEEYYSKNLKNGPSNKYYPDKTIAEKLNFVNNVKNGEWVQYYKNGHTWLKSNYLNGRLNGKFEAWFEDGKLEFSGQYKNDSRDGTWRIYKNDESLAYQIEYKNGITNDRKLDIDLSDFMDSLERNKDKIADPEKTGNMW